MLVLSRKPRESIIIDRNIEVTVLGVSGGKVRLGISAPREIPVRRQEIEPHETAECTHERLREREAAVPCTV